MAIVPETQYPGKVTPSTPQYPYGQARNISAPGDGTGTPWEQALVNDIFGFQQALLSDAGIVPSGNPDQVGASDYLDAIKAVINKLATTTPDVNFFDNSNFQIHHRAALVTVGAANVYNTIDRWQVGGDGAAGDGNYTVSLISNTDINGGDIASEHYLNISLQQGVTAADFFFGQRWYNPVYLSGKTITISFWINNQDGASTDYNNLVVGAIPVGITGVVNTVKSTAYSIAFGGGWQLITKSLTFPSFSPAAIVNPRSCFIICPCLWDSNLDVFNTVTFDIGDIYGAMGPAVPVYRSKSHSDEDMLAIQYYEKGGGQGSHGFSGSASSGFVYFARTPFAAPKRFTPVSLTLTPISALGFNNVLGSTIYDQSGFRETRTCTSNNNQAFWEASWTVDCEQLDGM